MADESVFGWSCQVTYRPYGTTSIVTRQIRRRGKSPGCVVRAVRRMNGYQCHGELVSYTRDEWIRAFGVGTETGRYWIG